MGENIVVRDFVGNIFKNGDNVDTRGNRAVIRRDCAAAKCAKIIIT
jgi:hypothetical protein